MKGARVTLEQCLGVKERERVTIVETPLFSCHDSLVRANRILWWYRYIGRDSKKLEKTSSELIRGRQNIVIALKAICEENGCPVEFYGIDTCKLLDTDFKWTSKKAAEKTLSDLSNTDVLIDLTLFGLDELPPAKKTRRYASLRQEILSAGRARGADLHIVSDRSFTTGAMCADYEKIAGEVRRLEETIKNSRTLDILAGKETDLRVQINPERVFSGTGIIHKVGEYHFLPSGIVGVCLERGGLTGRIVLKGPSYAIGTFSEFPMTIEIDTKGKITNWNLSEDAPYYELVENMFSFKEAKYFGELIIGLNPRGDINSIDPMEFYVARGGVSLALGRNDHIGGDIEASSEGSLHVHASVPGATIELDDREIVLEHGKLLMVEERE